MKILCGAFLIILCISARVAYGEFYSYTDSKGEVHFVDGVDKVPKKYRKQLKDAEPQGNVNVMDNQPLSGHGGHSITGDSSPKTKKSVSRPKVEVFMTSWCGYCSRMIYFLKEKGIPYAAYDIENDKAAETIFKSLGGRGVPMVRVGSHVIRGYNPEGVMEYYNAGD